MADFRIAYELTMKVEGGYSNNATDRGGETYCGISRKMHPEWKGWKIVDTLKSLSNFPLNLNNSTELKSLVCDFYKQVFWDTLSLDALANQQIANELYDTGVNMGTGVAANFLQTALNVTNRNGREYADLKIDGNVGSVTIQTLNKHPRPAEVLKVLNCLQGEKYINICLANPSQEIFMTSWLSRVAL